MHASISSRAKSLFDSPRRCASSVSLCSISGFRVTEIIASSKKSFDDALENGVKRATKTLKNVAGAWVASQDVVVAKGKIAEYRVRLKVTFVLAE